MVEREIKVPDGGIGVTWRDAANWPRWRFQHAIVTDAVAFGYVPEYDPGELLEGTDSDDVDVMEGAAMDLQEECNQAVEFLCGRAPHGWYFGITDSGAFGLWSMAADWEVTGTGDGRYKVSHFDYGTEVVDGVSEAARVASDWSGVEFRVVEAGGAFTLALVEWVVVVRYRVVTPRGTGEYTWDVVVDAVTWEAAKVVGMARFEDGHHMPHVEVLSVERG